MASVTVVLKKSKTDAKGTAPVYVRIADRNRTLYWSLGERIRPSQWNGLKEEVRSSHKRADDLNKLIRDKTALLQNEIYRRKAEGEEPAADELKALLEGKRTGLDFLAFGERIVSDFESQGKISTSRRYRSILKKLRAYVRGPLSFERVTPTFLREYETHLVSHYGNRPNTVASNFRAIRSILYKAIREGYASQAENPFFQFKIRRERADRTKLSPKQILALEALDLSEGSLLWHVRNYFLFSFYCAGVRFRDLCLLKWENVREEEKGLRLVYKMSKTGSKKSIRLFDPAREILDFYRPDGPLRSDAYVFPLLDSDKPYTPRELTNRVGARNALVNKYLKKLAAKAEIPANVSFHVSRHSFADYARRQGWDVYSIGNALAHGGLKATEHYLKGFDEDALDDKMGSLELFRAR